RERADEARRIASPLEPPRSRLAFGRKPDDGLEATPEYALSVERHLRGVHGLLELRILHDRLIDAVAVLLVPIRNPCQRDHLAVLELHGLGKGRDVTGLSVVADRVGVIQSAVAQVGVAPFLGHPLVRVEVSTCCTNKRSGSLVAAALASV